MLTMRQDDGLRVSGCARHGSTLRRTGGQTRLGVGDETSESRNVSISAAKILSVCRNIHRQGSDYSRYLTTRSGPRPRSVHHVRQQQRRNLGASGGRDCLYKWRRLPQTSGLRSLAAGLSPKAAHISDSRNPCPAPSSRRLQWARDLDCPPPVSRARSVPKHVQRRDNLLRTPFRMG